MRVKIFYEQQNTGYFSDSEPAFFKIKVNKAPPQDYVFNHTGALYLDNPPLNPPGKKNTIYFRTTYPGEQEEKNRNIIVNILLGFLFVLMIIILPFAFMRFKRGNAPPYMRLQFENSGTHDFVLILSKTNFRYLYEPSGGDVAPDPFAPVFEQPSGAEPEPAPGPDFINPV